MPDNTLPTAQNLGNLTSTLSIADAVNSTDTVDFYSFFINNPSDVNIALTGLSADANIRLIQDINNNGVVDGNEVIASSTFTGTNPDSININNLGAGTYFVAVDRVGNNNTNYTLRLSPFQPSNLIAPEADLGNLSATPIVRQGFVGDFDTSDIYRFSLASASDINLTLTGGGATADPNVRIIRDANNNGVVDANDVVAFSANVIASADTINLNNQAAGTYFAQVYQFSGNTNYSLLLSNSDPSNLTLSSEAHLGNIGEIPITRVDSVGNTDTSDMFTFNLANISDINLSLTGLSANANFRLIRLLDSNNVVDAGEVIASSTNNGTTPDSINLNNQAAGIYVVQVFQSGNSNTSYTLRMSNADPSNLLAQEANLGNLGANLITRTGFVGNSDTSDIYRFSLANVSDINVSLTGLSDDAVVRLIGDVNNNGVVDFGEVIRASGVENGNNSEVINVGNQAAGNYFVQVYQFLGDTNYTLRLSNADPSNLIVEETNLGILSQGLPVTDGFHVNDNNTSDIWGFSLTSASDINVSLTHLTADADVRLIRDANNNRIVDAGEEIARSTRGGTTPDSINVNNQAAGNYFVQVYQFSGDARYSLRLSDDDPSDLVAEEENLGSLSTIPVTRFGNVGNLDTSDIYSFNLNSFSDNINIALTGLTANADVRLLQDIDNNGFTEEVSTFRRGGTLDETITLNLLAAGNYFVQVNQVSGEANYTLRLSTEQISNVISVHEDFGVLAAGGSGITRLESVGNFATSDIYRFSLDSTRNFSASISGLSADADLRLIQDFNSNGIVDTGEVIALSTNGSNLPDSINRVLGAGDYFLQAYQFNGDTVYNLAVNAL